MRSPWWMPSPLVSSMFVPRDGTRRNPDCDRRGRYRPVRGRGVVRPRRGSDHCVRLQRRPSELARSGFGAHVLVDPAQRSVFDVFREVRAERHMGGSAVVFECVGASGLIGTIVKEAEFSSRIYCAGGWYTGDTLEITEATRNGLTLQFGGGPMPQDWYGVLDAVVAGKLDPLPSVGKIIGLDEVPDALDQARRSEGPPRVVIHPNGDVE